MPILHDNRNMRPDLLDAPTESVEDIFAKADSEMNDLRQKQLFVPSKKRKNWKKKIKRTFVISTSVFILIALVGGFFAAKYAYDMAVNEVQTQVLQTVHDLKTNLNKKDEAELTPDELFLLQAFEILSDDDIASIVQSATSIEEIIYIFKTNSLDINRYLTPEKQKQLEDLLLEYAQDLETRIEELETLEENESSSDIPEQESSELDITEESETEEAIQPTDESIDQN